MDKIASAADVLEFWFSARVTPLWFNSTPEFDNEIRTRFFATFKAAVYGELTGWTDTPEGALALVIVLDQFPLNMFRGHATAFDVEALARSVAAQAVERGLDRGLDAAGKAFMYLPFMHSEDLADQDRSVALYRQAGLQDSLTWALHHRELIRRFGRFPHRNIILGRASTDEELAYLDSEEAFHG